MNPNGPDFDPEAVALGKVYALLIRAARQRKARQKQAAGQTEVATPQSETAPETADLRQPTTTASFLE